MKFTFKIALFLTAIVIVSQSCAVKKFVPEGKRLYSGADIEIKSDSIIENQNQLEMVLKQALRPEPNKRFLGMQIGLYYYYKMQQEKPGFINKFLYKKFYRKKS